MSSRKTTLFYSFLIMVASLVLTGGVMRAVGVFGSKALLLFVSNAPGLRDVLAGIGLSGLDLKPAVATMGFSAAVLLGLIAGLVPAITAYRAKITDILRTI